MGFFQTLQGRLVLFLIFLGIIFGSLVWFFSPFFALLNALIGAFIPPYVVILIIALIAAYAWSFGIWGEKKPSLIRGIIYCVLLVAILGIVFPIAVGITSAFGGGIIEVPGGGSIDGICIVEKLRSADIMGIQECFMSVNGVEKPAYGVMHNIQGVHCTPFLFSHFSSL